MAYKNIIFVIDNNYVQQFLVTVNSIFRNNDPEEYVIHIVHKDISYKNEILINDFINRNNSSLIMHTVPDDFINTDVMLGSRWASVVYYKLFAFFNIDTDKALYLDSDIIVDGDIGCLFDINMENLYIRGVEDVGMSQVLWNEKEHFNKIGLSNDSRYINAGVMLINLKLIREKESLDMLLDIYNKSAKRLLFNEQDLINMVWQNRIGTLHAAYNRLATDFNYRRKIMYDKSNVIFHYTVNKPWMDVYKNSREPYIWQVGRYLKYSRLEECAELYQKVRTVNRSPILRIKSWIKSMFCINQGMPLKTHNLLRYIVYKM